MTTKNDSAATQASSRFTRRQFLTQAVAAAAGLTVIGPTLANQLTAPGAAPIIVGQGAHRYEWVPDWLTPPGTLIWGNTHGIAQDAAGRIYITHTVHPDSPSGDAIAVFDKHGKFLTSWGKQFRGGGHGLDLRKEGHQEFLYHCDTEHRVVTKTALDGTVIWNKTAPVESGVYKDGSPFIPTNVAFAPDGGYYIADGYGSSWIHQYSAKDEYVRTFGGLGTDPGKVHTPHGLWVDTRLSEPALVVADRSNHRLQYFTKKDLS